MHARRAIKMTEKSNYDRLMHRLCVGMGWCGCMKDNRPLHVDDFIPRSGLVYAEQFAEWIILADGENPNDQRWSETKSNIATIFEEIMGSNLVDVSELRWSSTIGYAAHFSKKNSFPSKIGTATLLVSDYNQAVQFYVGVLGFQLIEDYWMENHTKRWVRVAPPGAQTALLLAQPKNDKERAALGNQTGGRVSFFLETDDFTRDHAAMRAKGVEFKEAPRHEKYGTVAVFSDPWGNLWDLIEPRQKR